MRDTVEAGSPRPIEGGLFTEFYLQPPRYKTGWREICAILPVYLSDGTNGTEITYLDGTVEQIGKRLCWVLDDLLFHLKSSVSVLTRQSRTVFGKNARRVPLALKQEFSLVPVKGREPVSRYDAATGYVVLRHVQKLVSEEQGLRIWFSQTTSVHVLDTPHTLLENLRRTSQLTEE